MSDEPSGGETQALLASARASSESQDAWTLGYRPALDGVRALAIAGVLLVHLDEQRFSLGGYGVDVFFVLSGFLITQLLLQERRDRGRIRFTRFYARRALRLLPALYAALAVSVVYAMVFKSGEGRSQLLTDAGFGAVYLKNWQGLFGMQGDSVGPLVHLWSLSLEEQFYVMWPPVLGFCLARRKMGLAAGLAAVAVAMMIVMRLFAIDDPSTLAGQRADALFLGCLAAIALFWSKTKRPDATLRGVGGASMVAAAALAILLLGPLTFRDHELFQRAGITGVALLAVVLVVGVVLDPTSWVSRVCALRPFVAIGRISYGLYVWHLLVFKLMPPKLLPANAVLSAMVLVAVSVCIAALSFVVIERPALRLKDRLH